MPPVSESSADLTGVTGGETSSSFERRVPSGNVSSEAGAIQNETSTTNAGQDGTTMAKGDKCTPNEAIIAILEDWAAWERGLEKEAEKSEVARDIKDIADEPAPLVENDTLQRDPESSQCIVTEFDDNAPVQITPIPVKSRSAPIALRATTGQLYPTRRDRRRAERNDPVARTRREALKVWTADQTRRRSSAGDLALDHGQVKAGLTLKDWDVRRSSAEETVDQARKESRSRQEHPEDSIAGGLCMSAPPDSQHRPSRHAKKSSKATDKTVSRWRGPHPGRGGRGGHDKIGRPATDGKEVWEGEARTAPPTPRTPGSFVAGRASPWARSPSRETAGGILVKHCFFYGPAGKIALGRSPNTTPSFESQWMRKFREEVQGNPNWWAGPGQYGPGRSPDLSHRSVFRRTSSSKRPAYPLRTGASTTSEKGGASRNTNLWDEVRFLLARSRRSDGTNLARCGSNGGADAGAATPERVDALSFGDRLRCTPLSQGAWLIDNAVGERSSSVGSWRDDDGAAVALAKQARGGTKKAPARVQDSSEEVLAARAAVDHSPKSDNSHPRRKGTSWAGECGNRTSGGDVGSGGQRKSLQSVHEAILAKLRGKIDPFTREEIVLRAAEDAKGALARDPAYASSPRRGSAGVRRLLSGGKEGLVPAPIDYDKVEATLSLIELASRAAGPDAGKQMLQALEGLDKIHQRVSDDEVGVEKRSCASEENSVLKAASARVEGGDKVLTVAEASGDRPRGDLTPIQTLPNNKAEPWTEVVGKEKGPHKPSRRISLAVSDVSDETMGSTPTGVVQSIGNWLRRADRSPSRQHSFASDAADMDRDTQQRVRGREGFPSPLSNDPEKHVRGDIEAINNEEPKLKERGHQEEVPRARRFSVTAQQSREVDDRTSSNGTSHVDVQATGGEHYGLGKASPGKARDNRGMIEAVDAVPTAKTHVSATEPDDRILGPPMGTHCASQSDKAALSGSLSSARKAVEFEKSESPRQYTALRKKAETHRSRVVSPEKRRERTNGTDKEIKLQPTTANTTGPQNMRVKVAGTQRVGFSLNDSCRRDSWISLGTRPKRGCDGREIKPVREVARTAASVKLFGDGRSRAKRTDATGTCAIAADLRDSLASGAPSKVCAKLVWPRPGPSVSRKPENLPKATSIRESSVEEGTAPGIVRRSPLIDAFHPAVAKQRAFKLTLRKTGAPGVPPPKATEENKRAHASQEIRSRKHQDVAEACGPTVNSIAEKASTARRNRRPLSVAPPSSPPSPAAHHSSCPSPLPTGPQLPVGEEIESGNETAPADTAARAVKLTAVQCGCVDEWMAKAKYSLGPKIWECLGSSPAFYRIRDRFRSSLIQAGACNTVEESGRPLGHEPPVCGGEWEEKKLVATSKAPDKGAVFGPTSRKGEEQRAETANKAKELSGWGDRLSEKAALVVDAIMWTIATERERSTVCAAILQDRKGRSEAPSIFAMVAGHGGGDTRGEDKAEFPPIDTTLAVSWLRARRFAKSSRLVDGINIVDADVDLAFKRWEQSEQAGRPVLVTTTNRTFSPSRSMPEPHAPGIRTEGNAASFRSPDSAAIPRMCDAVGCSEGGRYGGICPTEKTRLCRKHRTDGMVDLGGRRCGRADCGRLAVRGSILGSTGRGALCSLHTQEDRVGLEGLAFVLLALAEARCRVVRRRAAMTGGTAGHILSEMSEEAADTAILKASAVRDLVLALTNQLLPSALPNTVHASLPGTEKCGAFEFLKDAVQPSSVSRSTLPVEARSVKEVAVVASTTDKLLRPKVRLRLIGDGRTSDQAREFEEVLDSGDIGAAGDHSSAVVGSLSPPPHLDPSAMVCSRFQTLPSVENEWSFRDSYMAMREQTVQLYEAEAHGEGQREVKEHGCRSGEGNGDRCLMSQARCSRVRSSFADGGDDYFRELGPQSLNAPRTGRVDCANRSSITGAAWSGIRWRGVDQVLGRNVKALKAVFRRYSRPSAGAREMALPDVLRFCDAFELRPGLVSTREIIDGFKEVMYPGVMGLTDEEIGYSVTFLEQLPSRKRAHLGLTRQDAFPPTGTGCISRQNGGRGRGEAVAPADPTADIVTDSCRAGEGVDEYCVNFPLDTGGNDHARTPSRQTSTTSSGAGGRGKTAYLGRAQKFPLRRVESTIASSDQDFGLAGGSIGSSAGDSVKQRASFRGSSIGRMGSRHLSKNAGCDVMAGVCEAKDPPVAPGLSLPKFLEWMSEVVVKCPAPVKSFGHAFARLPNEQRFGRESDGRSGPLLADNGKARGVSFTSRHNAAKAVVMLQWMELSRGMKNGVIPPFNLSSCLAEATRLQLDSPIEDDRLV